MFSTLVEYKVQAYYDEHPEMYLVTPEGGYVSCRIGRRPPVKIKIIDFGLPENHRHLRSHTNDAKDSRIGQLIIMPVVNADFVNDLGGECGKGAFGSTGK